MCVLIDIACYLVETSNNFMFNCGEFDYFIFVYSLLKLSIKICLCCFNEINLIFRFIQEVSSLINVQNNTFEMTTNLAQL